MAATDGFVCAFPIYFRIARTESLTEISERFVHALTLANKALLDAPVHGFPPLHKIAVYTGIALSGLNLGITNAVDLLRHPKDYLSRLEALQGRTKDLTEAISFFREEFIPARQYARERLTDAFLDHVFLFTLDSRLSAMLGASQPGIQREQTTNCSVGLQACLGY
jgi:hypothetical protein